MTTEVSTTEITNVLKAVQILSKFNWEGMLQALESASVEAKAKAVFLTVEEIASIVGVFIPVSAIVANDMAAAQIIFPIIEWYLVNHSEAKEANIPKVSVFNQPMDAKGLFQ